MVQVPSSCLSSDEDWALNDLSKLHDVGLIAMKAFAGGLVSSSAAAFAFFAGLDNAVPIWGVQRESELREFLDCARDNVRMTDELSAVIEKDKRELTGNFCRGCGYCKPCPAGIDIPWVGRMTLLLRRAPFADFATPEWQAKMKQVDNCIHCGACKSRCPYGIDGDALVHDNQADYVQFMREKGLLSE